MSPRAAGGGAGVLLIIGIIIGGRMMGCDPGEIQQAVNVAQQAQQQGGRPVAAPPAPGEEDPTREFIAVILADTEDVWSRLFREQVQGGDYEEPKLVMFREHVRTDRCGMGTAAMGPFYCPGDRVIYVPPSFFDDLARRHHSPGDFARAYVIAHEVAHHVQNLLQLNQRLQQVRRDGTEQEINQQSVRLELQADFLAGVWAHHAHRDFHILEDGDIEEGIQAASQIGDDRLQLQAQGYTVPERYTHGTSAQRVRWFRRGLETGRLNDCLLLSELPYSEL